MSMDKTSNGTKGGQKKLPMGHYFPFDVMSFQYKDERT
jgi:hypothetical protein